MVLAGPGIDGIVAILLEEPRSIEKGMVLFAFGGGVRSTFFSEQLWLVML